MTTLLRAGDLEEHVSRYLKYVYQMFVSAEYVTLSFHVYNATWLYTAFIMNDPFYFLLFRSAVRFVR